MGALKAPGWAEAVNPDQPGRRRTADSAGHRPPLTKGSGAVRPKQKGRENRLGAQSAQQPQWRLSRGVRGRHGGCLRAGRGGPLLPLWERSPGGRRPCAPRTAVRLAGGAPAGGGRSGPAALGGSRRGWFSDAELRVGEERDARGSGEEGGVRGGRRESRCQAVAREAGARAAGGRRWHRLQEPPLLRSEFPNRARRSGSPAPVRRPPVPGSGPRRLRPLLLPAPPPSRPLPLEEESREPAGAAPEEPAAGPSGSRAAAAGCVCASVPRSRPMPGTCVKASCAQSPSHTLLSK